MTNEQLIIYIYGIYPEGGFSALAILLFVIIVIATWGEAMLDDDALGWVKLHDKVKIPALITTIILSVGYFIPSKNTFLAIVATPSLVKSLEDNDGKLNKVSRLLDKALNEALEGEIK